MIVMLARWWRWWRGNAAGRAELVQFNQAELNNLARDVGVNAAELHSLAGKWPNAADLLSLRMQQLGLDGKILARRQPELSRALQKNCALCATKAPCEHDLRRRPADPGWRRYCSNADALMTLATQRASYPEKSRG
jgi:hypothetical protein